MEKVGFVYIMASGRNGTIYIGVTSGLAKRALEHRTGIVEGFTKNTAANAWSGLKRTTVSSQHGGVNCK